jgi:DNA-directed RNA polymerase II subunit RPB2
MSDQFNWNLDTWTTLDSYFAQNKILSQHQIESYNDLVDYVIPQIIERNNPIVIATDYDEKLKDFKKKYVIEFLQTYLSKPLIQENNDVIKPLLPNEARLRGLTYSAPMFIDVRHTLILKDDAGKDKKLPGDAPMSAIESKIPFFKLPVMLHSKYCHLSDRSDTSLAEMNECEYDQGGYFIVNGGEKVIISQERVAENQVFVWAPPKSSTSKYSHEAEVKTSIDQRFYPVKTNKVMLTKEPSAKVVKDSMVKGGIVGRTFRVKMPYLKEEIPLFVMFRALGVTTEREIYEMILSNVDAAGSNYVNLLLASAEEAKSKGITTQDSALQYISKQLNLTFTQDFQSQETNIKLKYVKDILNRELFPHIGPNSRKKAFFMGYMTRKLMDCYFGIRPYDDRDHYGNKRVDLTGPLLTQLFRANFIKLVKDLKQQILPKLTAGPTGLHQSIRKIIQSCNIESKIKYGLSTGNWSTQKTAISSSKKGIAQVLSRLSGIGAISHIRRVQSPLERAGSKIVAPRRLHGTHYGMCCPNETPEGGQIGIVKNFSMQTHVTIQTSDYPIRMALTELGVKDLSETSPVEIQNSCRIFVNGDWFGVIADRLTKKLYDQLKTLKRHGIIVPYISLAWMIDWKEIHIQTDGGRYSRPLYIVNNNELLIKTLHDSNEGFRKKFRSGATKWMEYLSGFNSDIDLNKVTINQYNGALIEYLDTNELENAMVAMTTSDLDTNAYKNTYYMYYSHCEIHPMMMMGVTATMIPFSDHNQSPRNCYQSSMGKQAISYFVTNYNSRMDTMAHVLVYGHRPFVATRTTKYTLMDNLPYGTQSQLLYACFTGYNQEDSVIINGDAVERGFFNTIFYRTYKDKEQRHKSTTTASEKLTKPDKKKTRDIKHGSDHGINDEGIPQIGAVLEGGDLIIGKVVEFKEPDQAGFLYKDVSTAVRANETGTVDLVIPNAQNSIHPYNAEGHRFVAARVSILRKPEIGDKFACYDDQTEVLTNGGWKFFKDLQKTDQVATLSQGKYLQYEVPQQIYDYDYKGKMYSIDSKMVNLRVTPNHKLYVKLTLKGQYELIQADQVDQRKHWHLRVSENQLADVKEFVLPGFVDDERNTTMSDRNLDMDAWLDLFGLFLSEGSLDHSLRRTRIYTHKQRVKDMLAPLEDILKLHLSPDESSHRSVICDKQLYHYLKQFGQSTEKFLPDWVWNLSQRQCVLLIKSILCGDGYKRGNSGYLSTSSTKLANDFQRLCLHAGFSGNKMLSAKAGEVLEIKGIKTTRSADNWKVSVIDSYCNTPAITSTAKTTKVTYEDYDGKVYCCQVSTGILYVRREGIPVYSGNSRSAQKGTGGMFYSMEDLPMTCNGLVPDIIMNPHGIPSRMTAGKLIETLLGKVAVSTCKFQDATPFAPFKLDDFRAILRDYGFDDLGREVMYNGQTGQMFEVLFFFGSNYYQRLKHMVADKVHARESGPVQLMTRQPSEGRSRDGGLRLGEICIKSQMLRLVARLNIIIWVVIMELSIVTIIQESATLTRKLFDSLLTVIIAGPDRAGMIRKNLGNMGVNGQSPLWEKTVSCV